MHETALGVDNQICDSKGKNLGENQFSNLTGTDLKGLVKSAEAQVQKYINTTGHRRSGEPVRRKRLVIVIEHPHIGKQYAICKARKEFDKFQHQILLSFHGNLILRLLPARRHRSPWSLPH